MEGPRRVLTWSYMRSELGQRSPLTAQAIPKIWACGARTGRSGAEVTGLAQIALFLAVSNNTLLARPSISFYPYRKIVNSAAQARPGVLGQFQLANGLQPRLTGPAKPQWRKQRVSIRLGIAPLPGSIVSGERDTRDRVLAVTIAKLARYAQRTKRRSWRFRQLESR